jgi:hypothetical protein
MVSNIAVSPPPGSLHHGTNVETLLLHTERDRGRHHRALDSAAQTADCNDMK